MSDLKECAKLRASHASVPYMTYITFVSTFVTFSRALPAILVLLALRIRGALRVLIVLFALNKNTLVIMSVKKKNNEEEREISMFFLLKLATDFSLYFVSLK